jgi:SprT-like family
MTAKNKNSKNEHEDMMTNEQLKASKKKAKAFCKVWQKRLKLDFYKVKITFSDTIKNELGIAGQCKLLLYSTSAEIVLATELLAPHRWKFCKNTIIHEFIHLILRNYHLELEIEDNKPEVLQDEIETITETLAKQLIIKSQADRETTMREFCANWQDKLGLSYCNICLFFPSTLKKQDGVLITHKRYNEFSSISKGTDKVQIPCEKYYQAINIYLDKSLFKPYNREYCEKLLLKELLKIILYKMEDVAPDADMLMQEEEKFVATITNQLGEKHCMFDCE